MEVGQIVNHERHGEGTLTEITDKVYVVDFNGSTKKLMKAFTKFESVEKSEKRIAKKVSKIRKKNESKLTVKDIYSSIIGTRKTRHSNWEMVVKTGLIMAKADELGSFISSIVETALNGGVVSEKQAWAVAYFAEKNELINA